VLKGQEKAKVVAIQAGAFGDTLHAIGLFIEQAGRAWKEIAADGMGRVTIRWEDAPQTQLDPPDLEALRRVARMYRGLGGTQDRSRLGSQLRAMGRRLDQLRAHSFTVSTVPEGLSMSARAVEGESARIYTSRQVARLEREQIRQRTA
jgi:hypothetical protein